RRGRVLAFVEVKARGDPRGLIEPHRPAQRRRMHRAAAAYLARHPPRDGDEVRFDLVTIRTGARLSRPTHLPHGAEA
ncbi:MAG: YraN family protein, partial [Thermoleophilia bacterium]